MLGKKPDSNELHYLYVNKKSSSVDYKPKDLHTRMMIFLFIICRFMTNDELKGGKVRK